MPALPCRSPQRALLLKALVLTLLLTACSGSKPRAVSERGMEICRQRKADSPAGSSSESIRQAFRLCLKTIDAELSQQANRANQQRLADAEAAKRAQQQEQSAQASAAERFSYCQIVREQVIEAERLRIRTLGPAMVATRQFGANSTEASDTRAAYDDAVARLDRLIPEPMRAGQPLLPDAVKIFSRCEPADFSKGS